VATQPPTSPWQRHPARATSGILSSLEELLTEDFAWCEQLRWRGFAVVEDAVSMEHCRIMRDEIEALHAGGLLVGNATHFVDKEDKTQLLHKPHIYEGELINEAVATGAPALTSLYRDPTLLVLLSLIFPRLKLTRQSLKVRCSTMPNRTVIVMFTWCMRAFGHTRTPDACTYRRIPRTLARTLIVTSTSCLNSAGFLVSWPRLPRFNSTRAEVAVFHCMWTQRHRWMTAMLQLCCISTRAGQKQMGVNCMFFLHTLLLPVDLVLSVVQRWHLAVDLQASC